VIYHGLLHVPLLWHVKKLSVLCESEGISAGKKLDSLPRNDAMAELWQSEFKVAYCRDPDRKLPIN
jgi:hypothetical protein